MSKQLKTYLLLVVVLAIWGTVVYRFVDAFTPEDPPDYQSLTVSEFRPTDTRTVDTFTISKLNRDPFLGKTYVKKKPSPKNTISKKKVPEKTWPTIAYRGLISGGSNVFIIEVNGSQFLFGPKDSNAEITLLRGNASEVTLQFGKEKKSFSIVE